MKANIYILKYMLLAVLVALVHASAMRRSGLQMVIAMLQSN